ncbi:MAG TPA: c-type cytochrome [Allosphingosinicella sp.]|nr:c-type cytochrome [Allosphingosinicella sp.]
MKRLGFALSAVIVAGAACAAPPPIDLARGEILYRQCFACHALEPDANTPAGPTLSGIVGRRIASEQGFDYSPALRRLAGEQPRWSPELLDRFLQDPEAVAPGTEMGFPGLTAEEDRDALIGWLATGSGRRP